VRGDPAIGNFGFALDLIGAPSGTFAFLRFNAGACLPGTNFGGVLCDFVPFSNLASCSFVPTGGTTGCSGSASCPLPLPALGALCGITLSTRWFGIEIPTITNNYVSNCLTWTISGS